MQYINIICQQKHMEYFKQSGAFAHLRDVQVGQSLGFDEALKSGAIHPSSEIIVACVSSSSLRDLSGLQQVREMYPSKQVLAFFDIENDYNSCTHSLKGVIKSLASERQGHIGAYQPVMEDAVDSGVSEVTDKLTKRQLDVLRLIQAGHPNKQIARDLGLCEGTVKIHCLAIFRILGVNNRTQAAMLANDAMI